MQPKGGGELIPLLPQFHDLLYENKYESQLWMLYDNNKYLVRSGDAFPLRVITVLFISLASELTAAPQISFRRRVV